jgi:hypothetical protein
MNPVYSGRFCVPARQESAFSKGTERAMLKRWREKRKLLELAKLLAALDAYGEAR